MTLKLAAPPTANPVPQKTLLTRDSKQGKIRHN